MGKFKNAMSKPISTGGHYMGMATAAAGMLATGSAAMGLVGYGTGYALHAIGQMAKESPNAGGRHRALNDKQFGK
jgi:hypothetical protein